MDEPNYTGSGGITIDGCACYGYTVNPNMGIMTGPPAALQQMLFNSANWQNWNTNAGTNYLNQVVVIGASNDYTVPCIAALARPFAVVTVLTESFELKIGTFNYVRGKMILWFEDAIPPGLDETGAFYNFCNNVEAVMQDINTQVQGGALLIRQITYASRPERNTVDDNDSFYCASFNVIFGTE